MTSLRSHVAGIDWLPIAKPRGATQLSLQYQLNQTQWWTENQLKTQQFKQLHSLLMHAQKTVPYYRETLKDFDATVNPFSLASHWDTIPVLTRNELQAKTEQLISQSTPAEHGKSGWFTTSGSTGQPVRVQKNDLTQLYWLAIALRDHLWHRRDMRKTLAAIRYVEKDFAIAPAGQQFPDWGSCTGELYENGPSHLLNLNTPIKEQISWLKRVNPDYLITYPSNLNELIQHYKQEKLSKPPALTQIQTIGETLDDATRVLCHDVLQLPVVDTYSTLEIGYIALQCPEHDHYHIQSEVTLVEILNEANAPCSAGETGRVVVTPLHNFTMPLLRYEVGDYAVVGESCPCGRGLPVITKLLRRVSGIC